MVLGELNPLPGFVRRARSYVLLANKSGTVRLRGPIVDRMKGGRRNEKESGSVRSWDGAKGKNGACRQNTSDQDRNGRDIRDGTGGRLSSRCGFVDGAPGGLTGVRRRFRG